MVAPSDVDILLVEDNADDADLTLRALRKNHLDHTVHHVRDGAEALAYLFSTGAYADRGAAPPPKVVLLDLKLPKVDGLEVLKKVKLEERTRKIPVVVLTSSSVEEDLLESYKLGVNSYIVKPVEYDKFLDAVNRLGIYWLLVNRIPR